MAVSARRRSEEFTSGFQPKLTEKVVKDELWTVPEIMRQTGFSKASVYDAPRTELRRAIDRLE